MKRTPILLFAVLLIASLASCSKPIAERSDYVLVKYTGAFTNGTVFDSNDPQLKYLFPGYPDSHFTSLNVLLGSGQVVPGFENAIIGMKEGASKTVTIKAKEAYGGYDASKRATLPKRILFPLEVGYQRDVIVPKAEFIKQTGTSLFTIGQTFDTENFQYNITGVNATDVSLYILKPLHDPLQLQGSSWNSTLARTTAKDLYYRQLIEDGHEYNTIYGPYNASLNSTHALLTSIFSLGMSFESPDGAGRISAETPDSITLDYNHPLAGQDLVFNITVNAVQKRK